MSGKLGVALAYPHALNVGGYPRDVRWLAASLAALGARVTLLSQRGIHSEGLSPVVQMRPLSDLMTVAREVDLVHVLGLYIPAHVRLFHALARVRVPLVVSPFANLMPFAHRVHRWKKALFLALISRWIDRAVLHTFGPVETESIRAHFGARTLFEATLGIFPVEVDPPIHATPNGGILQLLFFGRNDIYQKGIDLLLEGFARAVEAGGALALTIAGQPFRGSEASIRRFLEHRGLTSAVNVIGAVDAYEKWRLLSSADYLVFLSRCDGPPRPIREAIAIGTPVIVSPETNLGHIVRACDAGVETDLNPSRIAETLMQVGAGQHRERERFAAGAKRAQARLAWSRVAGEYLDGYQRCLTGFATG